MNKGKIYVYTVARPTATKVSEVSNNKNVKLNQTKISRGVANKFKVGLSAKTGRLATGLNVIVDNPFSVELPASAHSSFKKSDVVGREQLKLQYIKELEYGFEKDYLTDKPHTRNSKVGAEPSFYQTFKITCNDGLTIFDRGKINDDLAYYVMITSKKFANSRKELNQGVWPDAIHYIGLEQEDEEVKFKKRQLTDKAKGALTYGDLADTVSQRKFVKILLPKVSKGDLTDIQLYNFLSKAVEANERYKSGGTFLENFNKTLTLMETPDGREKIEALVFLQDLLNNWVVAEKAGAYKWLSKDIVLGHTKEQTINFLMNPEKQELQEELEAQLKAKLTSLL
tara:strand:+ start:8887 stop:9906 length:1020 start_codon:yes stop_codon:yes gene_type:complete